MACQIVHDSLHERGFTDIYSIRVDGELAGHGAVVGFGDEPKETVNEFFLRTEHRAAAPLLFRNFLDGSSAVRIRTQTNDVLLTLMLYDCARDIERTKILFHDSFETTLESGGATFRQITAEEKERMSPQAGVQVGDWGIESGGQIVGSGGVLFHYNKPYGDVYMSVLEPFRRRGFGSYLVQQLKRACYESGHLPAARCDVSNTDSRATLQKAGMLPCASILEGLVAD